MTRDLFLAACILYSGHETEITIDKQVAYFIFNPSPHVKQTVELFERGDLMINAAKLSVSYRKLRNSMMTAVKNSYAAKA